MIRGPFQVAGGRAVARFAADVDRLPVGRESIGGGIVVLPDAGRVAVGAHEVPVLRRPRPVQLVVVRHAFGGVEVKPALAACFLRTRVPGDRERLDPAVRKLDEVLLERVDAEGVLDGELGEATVTPVGPYEEPAVSLEEGA